MPTTSCVAARSSMRCARTPTRRSATCARGSMRMAIAYRSYWIANVIEARLPHVGDRTRSRSRSDILRIEPNMTIAMQLPARSRHEGAGMRPKRFRGASARSTRRPSGRSATTGRASSLPARTPASSGIIRRCSRTIAAGTARRPITTTTGTTRSTTPSAAIRAAAIRRRRATTPATARTPSARWPATTARRTRSASRPARNGSAAATWIGATARRRATSSACSGCSRRPISNDQNPNPDLAPDVLSNSWGCPASEGCTVGDELEAAVDSVVAGGILFVASAANDGPACETITTPPATYDASFVVGATDSDDRMAGYSSRGPVADVDADPARSLGAGLERAVVVSAEHVREPQRHQHGGAARVRHGGAR